MGDRVMPVLGNLGEQAVTIHENSGGGRLFDDGVGERWEKPRTATDAILFVEIKKHIGLIVVSDTVLLEQVPFVKIFIPVPELHVEATVNRLVLHLVVVALAVGHRPFPFGSAGRDVFQVGGHKVAFQ